MITSLAMTSNWRFGDEFSINCMGDCFTAAIYNMDNITVKSYMKNTQPVLYELLQHMILTFSDVSKRDQFSQYFTKTTCNFLELQSKVFSEGLEVYL